MHTAVSPRPYFSRRPVMDFVLILLWMWIYGYIAYRFGYSSAQCRIK